MRARAPAVGGWHAQGRADRGGRRAAPRVQGTRAGDVPDVVVDQARLGADDGAAGPLRQPSALLAARQAARRHELPQRDGLHPRPPRELRRLEHPGLALRRRPAVLQALRGQQPRRVRVPRRRWPARRERRRAHRGRRGVRRRRRGALPGRGQRRLQRRGAGGRRPLPAHDPRRRAREHGGRVPRARARARQPHDHHRRSRPRSSSTARARPASACGSAAPSA